MRSTFFLGLVAATAVALGFASTAQASPFGAHTGAVLRGGSVTYGAAAARRSYGGGGGRSYAPSGGYTSRAVDAPYGGGYGGRAYYGGGAYQGGGYTSRYYAPRAYGSYYGGGYYGGYRPYYGEVATTVGTGPTTAVTTAAAGMAAAGTVAGASPAGA